MNLVLTKFFYSFRFWESLKIIKKSTTFLYVTEFTTFDLIRTKDQGLICNNLPTKDNFFDKGSAILSKVLSENVE